jgi:hypothetical protein
MVLVGGQALAFWAAYYGTPSPPIAVTKDVDLLGTRADVERLARGLQGKAAFPRRGLTLLVGQVTKDLPDGGYINIDVLSNVYGDVTRDGVKGRAVAVTVAAGALRVMHPLDVLQGRLENVHGIAEKQDEHGLAQLRLAVEVTRGFLRDIGTRETSGSENPNRPVALQHIGRIETMALSDAGRKVAKRHGIHVADAIDPAPVMHIKPFVGTKLPQLLKLMSEERRSKLAGR